MEFLIAFGTDDGINLNDDHVGMAKYFYIYRFSNSKEELMERRENIPFAGEESVHGDPKKASATASVLQGIDVLVGKKFGPNLLRLRRKLVCVVVRTKTIANAIEAVHNNIDRVVEAKGGERIESISY